MNPKGQTPYNKHPLSCEYRIIAMHGVIVIYSSCQNDEDMSIYKGEGLSFSHEQSLSIMPLCMV